MVMEYYGRAGHLQRKIIELGEHDELTYGKILDLYGTQSRAKRELRKLATFDLIDFDGDVDDVDRDTKLEWAFFSRERNLEE